jgi:SAM-dependent methyltransferase
MERTLSCAILDGRQGVSFIQNRSLMTRWYDEVTHPAKRCSSCAHVFFDAPSATLLSRYYREIYPKSAASWYNADADHAASKVTTRAGQVIEIAARFGFSRSHHFHEIGCAFGGTVHELRRLGHSVTGTELNADAIAQGRERGNDAIYAEDDLAFFKRSGVRPNIVYGYHVLEHMPDPVSYLSDLASLLATDSIVIMFVPNAMALFPTVCGFDRYTWFAYPEHINLFSPRSALCLAQSSGFDIASVTTFPEGLEPEATQRAMGHLVATPVTTAIRQHLVTTGLMDEVLVIVMTRTDSPIARRYRDALTDAKYRCLANETFECDIRGMGETSARVDPGPSSPEANRHTADLIRAVETLIGNASSQATQSAHEVGLCRSARQAVEARAEQAEQALRAIESSTFWRASALPRRIIGWLRGRR